MVRGGQGEDKLQGSITVRWYVVFEGLETSRWWRLFTRPGMRHVWAYAPFGDGYISLNHGLGFTKINHTSQASLLEQGYTDMYHWCVSEGKMVLPCIHEAKECYNHMVFPMTCVSLVKSLLGLRFCPAITPWQLYKYLVENCLDVFEYKKISKLYGETHVQSL